MLPLLVDLLFELFWVEIKRTSVVVTKPAHLFISTQFRLAQGWRLRFSLG